mmetsp:Transcript_55312/g.142441  ORF Transcript_55312/g.142441 Transcript_55312/m.142441 type:complete len:413 (-) Transcript_55312:635-1873(-)
MVGDGRQELGVALAILEGLRGQAEEGADFRAGRALVDAGGGVVAASVGLAAALLLPALHDRGHDEVREVPVAARALAALLDQQRRRHEERLLAEDLDVAVQLRVELLLQRLCRPPLAILLVQLLVIGLRDVAFRREPRRQAQRGDADVALDVDDTQEVAVGLDGGMSAPHVGVVEVAGGVPLQADLAAGRAPDDDQVLPAGLRHVVVHQREVRRSQPRVTLGPLAVQIVAQDAVIVAPCVSRLVQNDLFVAQHLGERQPISIDQPHLRVQAGRGFHRLHPEQHRPLAGLVAGAGHGVQTRVIPVAGLDMRADDLRARHELVRPGFVARPDHVAQAIQQRLPVLLVGRAVHRPTLRDAEGRADCYVVGGAKSTTDRLALCRRGLGDAGGAPGAVAAELHLLRPDLDSLLSVHA